MEIAAGESRHLFRVVRARPGDEVTLLDGKGGVYGAVIAPGPGSRAEVISVEHAERAVSVDIAIPVIKAGRMDYAVEKCAELGVRQYLQIGKLADLGFRPLSRCDRSA